MRLLPYGPHAVLVEVDSTEEAMALYEAAIASGVDAREIVPGARTVLFDGIGPNFVIPEPNESSERAPRHVDIPTVYDGPDLEDAAALVGLTPAELVGRHTSTTFTVAFCGFAPGFAYCTGFGLSVPRLESPRPRVEPGSVGLAGEFTGIYPTASPGGWRLIGRTDVLLWDPERVDPALLSPGTTVRFVASGASGDPFG
ncbi:MAG TPA: allophanate hydrolase subunit 1 [Nocardioidaceae bacterium]|nr:allophanate hydrolase subunit 1 [Nocardioidaceae bacterium]